MVGPWISALFGGEDEDLGDYITIPIYSGLSDTIGPPFSTGIQSLKYDHNTDTLINLINNSTATNLSLHDARTNANYSPPVGKKFVFMCIISATNATQDHTMKIRSSATADTADGTVLHDQTHVLNSTTAWKTTGILEVAASQFLTLEKVAGTGNARISSMIGYETAA